MTDAQREAMYTLREKVRKILGDTSRCRQQWPDEDVFRRVQGLLGQTNVAISKYLEDNKT